MADATKAHVSVESIFISGGWVRQQQQVSVVQPPNYIMPMVVHKHWEEI